MSTFFTLTGPVLHGKIAVTMPRKTDSEPAAAEIPGANPIPPPGVPADVNVKFRVPGINPADYMSQREPEPTRNVSDELNRLALDEDQELAPPSIFAQFCENFSEYAGLAMVNVVRLPDPADKRAPGSQYARVNFGEIEQLGSFSFDPNSLLASLQMINGNSGGVFRLWLTDESGQMIPGAHLSRLAVYDPLGARQPAQQPAPAPPPVRIEAPAPRELTEDEKQIKELQRSIMQNALQNLMHPPQPPPAPPVSPLSALPAEDQLAVMLLSKTDILGQAIEKISTLVKAGEAGAAPAVTWQDRAVELVTQNPQLIERLSATSLAIMDRIVGRIFGPDPRYDQPQYIPPQQQPRPVQQQAHPYAAGPAPAQPHVSDHASAYSNLSPDAPTTDDDNEDDQDMALLEELLAYLSSNDEITAQHPIFKHLRTTYPARFRFYVELIAQAPSIDPIIAFLKQAGPLYATLLDGPMSAHYRTRIEQLRQLCIAATTKRAAPAPAPEPTPEPGPPAPDANNYAPEQPEQS